MLVKSRLVVDGPGPSEVVIEIATASGPEEVVVQRDSLKGGNLEVGQIGQKSGMALIELPRESTTGKWRLWVPESEMMQIA